MPVAAQAVSAVPFAFAVVSAGPLPLFAPAAAIKKPPVVQAAWLVVVVVSQVAKHQISVAAQVVFHPAPPFAP